MQKINDSVNSTVISTVTLFLIRTIMLPLIITIHVTRLKIFKYFVNYISS